MIFVLSFSSLSVFAPSLISSITHTKAETITSNKALLMMLTPDQFDLLLAIFIALFLSLDISNDTLKNIVARGFSRKRIFISKFIASYIGITITFIVGFILAYIVTIIGGGKIVGLNSNVIIKLFAFYFGIIGLASVYGLVSTIIAKSSGSLVACILINFFVPIGLTVADSILKIKQDLSISNFWIANVTNNKPLISILISLIYIIITIIVGLSVSNKKEIK